AGVDRTSGPVAAAGPQDWHGGSSLLHRLGESSSAMTCPHRYRAASRAGVWSEPGGRSQVAHKQRPQIRGTGASKAITKRVIDDVSEHVDHLGHDGFTAPHVGPDGPRPRFHITPRGAVSCGSSIALAC